ncbi:uncharacterized protein B0H64DRAFT_442995 [Chaetomium fimeti]|uniref:Uncharacterized protein n=1 Tax=Chaetomium fimeti TaxID=1854472 RepID=A0AAE0LQN1_9PEZI|nr:hypothetical protein B0H64DRAFT_442995 [Chaetomium fimeti]
MKATATILLAIATLAAAVPNPNAENPGVISARQGCSYGCVCQSNPDGSADTEQCCTGGTMEGNTCGNMNFAAAVNFASCCPLGQTCNVPAGCDPIPGN